MDQIIFKQEDNASNQIWSLFKIHCSNIHNNRLQQNITQIIYFSY